MRALLEIALVFSLIVAPVQELAPVIARSQSEGARLLGFMLAALALGGLAGNWLRIRLEPWQQRAPLLAAALGAAGFTLVMLGVSTSGGVTIVSPAVEYGFVLATMFALGIAWDILYVITLTDVETARRDVSGAFTGLYFALTLGGLTLGAVLLGWVIDLLELNGGMFLSAALLLLAAGYFLRTRNRLGAPGAA